MPVAFAVAAVIGNDAGGPCFWPMAGILGAGIGWIGGTVIAAVKRRR